MGVISDILGENGIIAKNLEGYTYRPQQEQMSQAVYEAFRDKKHLIVEAGTGVGKSFGYLVPAVLKAQEMKAAESQLPIIISTGTKQLQGQLLEKDIPFLQSVLPFEFKAVLGKGRGNYLSLRRYDNVPSSTADPDLDRVTSWLTQEDCNGDRDTIEGKSIHASVWNDIRSDGDDCMQQKCKHFGACYFHRARAAMSKADILIVNHHLFFIDLALQRLGAGVLPPYRHVILDEAHEIENIAAQSFGGELSRYRFKLLNDALRNLMSDYEPLRDTQQALHKVQAAADVLFDGFEQYFENQTKNIPNSATVRLYRREYGHAEELAKQLMFLCVGLETNLHRLPDENAEKRMTSIVRRCGSYIHTLDQLKDLNPENEVAWLVKDGARNTLTLRIEPMHIGQLLANTLFKQNASVILTSATIATTKAIKSDPFAYHRARWGFKKAPDDPDADYHNAVANDDDDYEEDVWAAPKQGSFRGGAVARELVVDTPFDYARQVRILVPTDMPHPGKSKNEYLMSVDEYALTAINGTPGGVFLLFTSYEGLRSCAHGIIGDIVDRPIFVHGGYPTSRDALPRAEMLRLFKEAGNGVLFGTESFWKGVDIPGSALETVVIAKLPFPVPSEPRFQARCEAIKAQGGDSFKELSMPQAIIKLKQGFGRLIRRSNDKGTVMILDSRILAGWGKPFLDALPDARVETRTRNKV